MDRLRRAALLTQLIERLRRRGSWCGETHVQKATLFLQDLTRIPMGFDFILYKHGPFSFDLRDELTSLRADGLIKLEPQWPYGPRIMTTDRSKYIQGLYSKTLEKYNDSISFIAEKLGAKGVADLERLATALYVTQRAGTDASIDKRAAKLTALKPHITRDDAVAAAMEVDCIIEEAAK
jgi:uncharacterized protein YwgA